MYVTDRFLVSAGSLALLAVCAFAAWWFMPPAAVETLAAHGRWLPAVAIAAVVAAILLANQFASFLETRTSRLRFGAAEIVLRYRGLPDWAVRDVATLAAETCQDATATAPRDVSRWLAIGGAMLAAALAAAWLLENTITAAAVGVVAVIVWASWVTYMGLKTPDYAWGAGGARVSVYWQCLWKPTLPVPVRTLLARRLAFFMPRAMPLLVELLAYCGCERTQGSRKKDREYMEMLQGRVAALLQQALAIGADEIETSVLASAAPAAAATQPALVARVAQLEALLERVIAPGASVEPTSTPAPVAGGLGGLGRPPVEIRVEESRRSTPDADEDNIFSGAPCADCGAVCGTDSALRDGEPICAKCVGVRNANAELNAPHTVS